MSDRDSDLSATVPCYMAIVTAVLNCAGQYRPVGAWVGSWAIRHGCAYEAYPPECRRNHPATANASLQPAKGASVSKALAALSAQLNLTYTFEPGLDHPLEGDYSGTLQHVLKRILDGYDYVIEISDDGIELKVLGLSAVMPAQHPDHRCQRQHDSNVDPSQAFSRCPLCPRKRPFAAPPRNDAMCH